jgi:hypothetical protein
MCTTCWSPSRRGLPRERRRLHSPALPAAGDAMVAGCRGLRPSGFPETSGRAAVSRPVSTALRRQGRVVTRAKGPRHHRPRLRHEMRRRGAASAASGPQKARAQTVASVCQSAPPPADRSVQRLMQRHHWTAPAHGWAARHYSSSPSARQRARTAATPYLPDPPPEGLTKEGTGAAALCPCRWFLSPPSPSRGRCGSHPLLHGGGCAALTTGPLLSLLPSCKRLECTAAGPLRQGPASLRAPAEPPPQTGRQRRPEGVPDGLRCWRTAVAGPERTGDRWCTRVPGAPRA